MSEEKVIREFRCKHLRDTGGMAKTYFLFDINDSETLWVCRLCFAAIQEQIISLLTEVRVKVR